MSLRHVPATCPLVSAHLYGKVKVTYSKFKIENTAQLELSYVKQINHDYLSFIIKQNKTIELASNSIPLSNSFMGFVNHSKKYVPR